MAFYILAALAALCVAFVASQAALPEETYWNSALPNTPMPRAISNVLQPANVGRGGETVPDLGRFRKSYRSRYSKKKKLHYTLESEKSEEAVPDLRRIGYSRRGYNRRSYNRSFYNRRHYDSDKDNKVLVNEPSAPWFLEKDLVPGNQMEMEIARPGNNGYAFVPRQVADSIPFSSDKLPAILTKLSVKPESPTAQLIKDTLKECELPAEEGEVKTCATSLESMIDFSVQRLGKNIQAVSTEAEKDTKLQKFTFLPGLKRIGDGKAVACHKQDYAYAVFYCHDVTGARAYVAPFVGTSGTKVKAVGVCHTNTSTWNPEHEAFKILDVKPGGEPVCHFLPEYNVLWTRK
uniref:BURP domain-containing protein n=1 Tax=Kalanchoe fedtschenkoi TaxID=63787 RepID=A0A7N0TM47_KALFE